MTILNQLAPYAHWFLRLTISSVFIFHGVLKFMDLEGFSQMLNLSVPLMTMVALAEGLGGGLVLLGGLSRDQKSDLMTRVGALVLIPVMLGAIALYHWGRWNFVPADGFPMGGMQFQVTLLLICIYLLLKGNNINAGVVPPNS
jgi:putative oxidoreductase